MKSSDVGKKQIWKNKKLWSFILLGVFLILFRPPILDAIGQRFRCVFYALVYFQSFHDNLTTPYSGEHVLPSSVQEMLRLLREHKLNTYQISGKIMSDPLIHQRIVEAAWPRRMSPESHHKFVFVSECDQSPNCQEIERRKEVVLVFCR